METAFLRKPQGSSSPWESRRISTFRLMSCFILHTLAKLFGFVWECTSNLSGRLNIKLGTPCVRMRMDAKSHAARSWSGRTEKGAAARRVCVFFWTFFQAEPGRYQKSMIRHSNCILRWLSLADNELGHPCGSLAAAFDSTFAFVFVWHAGFCNS